FLLVKARHWFLNHLPYATLFRSRMEDVADPRCGDQEARIGRIGFELLAQSSHQMLEQLTVSLSAVAPDMAAQPLRIHGPPRIGEDRKSTRLNSSHVKISYTVFSM